MLVGEYTEMMAVKMKATINNNIEEKTDKDNLSQLTGNNQLSTRAAKARAGGRRAAGKERINE